MEALQAQVEAACAGALVFFIHRLRFLVDEQFCDDKFKFIRTFL